jgi:hypothetical protein
MGFSWAWAISIFRFAAGVRRAWRDLMMKYFREPQLSLETGFGDPYQQLWNDSGGQQTLWRIRVNNRSLSEPRKRVQVRVGHFVPWAIHGMPAHLRIRNQPESVQSFDLSPGGYEYVDVIQQSLPNGMLLLWHTIPWVDPALRSHDYSLFR